MVRSVEEIKAEIIESWHDETLALWVIGQLELLNLFSEERPPASIETITLDNGIYSFSGKQNGKIKYVVSGGLEGTRGHIDAFDYLHEARALMDELALICALLEPDEYIQKDKKREPLFSQKERAWLWSRSGLVDVVICLPPVPVNVSLTQHYIQIHEALGKNVRWFTTDEHSFFLEVLTRGQEEINLLQLMPEHFGAHASLLVATRDMTIDQFTNLFEAYSKKLATRLGRN